MTNIQLTQELVKSLFDYKDGFLYWKIKPAVCVKIGTKAGCLHKYKDGDRYRIMINGKSYMSSRLIFLYHKGYLPKEADHINRITTDDHIENLREASRFENSRNRGSYKKSSSQYKGVSLHSPTQKWTAGIRVNYKTKYLGLFSTEIDAALAYNKAAILYFGEFANLNILEIF